MAKITLTEDLLAALRAALREHVDQRWRLGMSHDTAAGYLGISPSTLDKLVHSASCRRA